MDYYLSIFIRELKEEKFYELLNLLESFSTQIIQAEKDLIIGQTKDINVLYCLIKLKESYPEVRFGFSQYIGLAKGLSKLAKFGEILISEETESKVIENFQITSLGMLSIEGMTSQILVCRIDEAVGDKKFPEVYKTKIRYIPRNMAMESFKSLLKVTKDILIFGPVSSGKTIFINQLIEEWSDKEVYRTICPVYPTQQTLKPVLDITTQILGISGIKRIEEKQHLIEKRLKDLGIPDIGTTYLAILDFLGLGEEESILEKLEIKTRLEIITSSVAEILKRISWIKPVVIIIEDIDNMDISSVNFVQDIMSKLTDDNIIFIFSSCRSQTNIPSLQEFELVEIDKKQLEDFVENSIGEKITLMPTTPLHVAQYLALYQEEKLSYFYSQYLGKSSLVSFSLPFADLKTIIRRRVELLAEKKEFLFALTLFGAEIDPLEFPGEQKDLHKFEYFVGKNFLKKYYNKYVFVSTALHNEIYNLVPDKETRHLRNADYYRRLEGYEEYAAYHYQMAGSYKKAVEFLIKSAELALKKGASDSGINYYNQALELCRRQKDAADLEILVAINEGLADIYRAIGDEERALKYYKVVLDSYKEILKE